MLKAFTNLQKGEEKMVNVKQDQELTCIVMEDIDNVATLLKDAEAGETLHYSLNGEVVEIITKQPIPFGHKVAIKPIQQADEVMKYGQVIGAATTAISTGEHVHIHNIEGIRGRGDKAKGEIN